MKSRLYVGSVSLLGGGIDEYTATDAAAVGVTVAIGVVVPIGVVADSNELRSARRD